VLTADDFEAAGVYDPYSPNAASRMELLTWLVEPGFTIEQMAATRRGQGLDALSGGDILIVPGPLRTRAKAMERTGLSADRLDAYAMAFGFAPLGFSPEGEIGITDAEADVLASLGSLSDASGLFSEAEVLSLFRVLGASLGRMADATLSLFLTDVESPHRQSDGVELPLTKKVFEAVQMLDGFIPSLDPMFRRLLLQSIERSRRATIGPRERLQYRYAVGFVDLVGFTEISASMSTTELSTFLREFEGRAYDVVNEAGARVVKLIGDEVMFVATDADSACRAAEALMSGFGTEGAGLAVLPRGGIAYGEVLVRGGDYYGSVVNLASRLADQAVPQELLVTEQLAETATRCTFEPAGRRVMKGFADPVTVQSLVTATAQ
jgi:adenylate cyclase